MTSPTPRPAPTKGPEPARPVAPPRPTKPPTRVTERKYVDIPATEWTPDKWPLPTPEQMDELRRLLPPVAAPPVEQAA